MESEDAKFYQRKRYLVTIFVFFGVAFVYLMKANLSIVLIDITHPKLITENNRTIQDQPEVDWNSKQVGFIIGAATYGHAPTTFISGILARKYGGATVFVSGLFLSTLSTLITPRLIYSLWLLTIIRIVDGVGIGLVDGSLTEIFLNWVPVEERTRHTITHSTGCSFGIIFSHIITSYIIHFLNWKAVFYITGTLVLLFSFVWYVLIYNRPVEDKYILEIERKYLIAKIHVPSDANTNIFSYPWKKIFTSKPVWAYFNEWFCCGWSSSFILYSLPLYIKDATNFNIRSVAAMSSIPILCATISELISSYVCDYIRRKKILDTTKMHRIFISVAHFGIALCLISLALWANFEASIILISLINALFGIKLTSYHSLPIDAFHRYAAIIKGFGLSFYTITNCLSPLLIGFIVTNHELSQWNLYFGFIVIFNIWSIFTFSFYGTGEVQSWAVENDKTKN